MHAQLADIADSLDRTTQRLDQLASRTPLSVWSARPEPGRWSAAECVAHLNLTSAAYVPLLERAVTEARVLPPIGGRRYRRDFVGAMFALLAGPLPLLGRFRLGRVRTSAAFVPTAEMPKDELVTEFARYQSQLKHLLREGDGLQLDRIRIQSPFGERVRYNAFSAFRILAPHQQRHLDQADEAIGAVTLAGGGRPDLPS